MAYMPKMTDFSPSGTIEKLYIYKASSLKDTEKIIPLLMHELTHAIEDYGLNQSNKRLDTELGKTGYFQYSQEKEDFLQSTINDLLYYFNYFETNAYIAQLSGELDQHRGYYETVNDILEYIKTLKVYKHYQKMFSYANELIDEKNIPDNVKQKILYIVSTNSKYKFTTYNRFVKFLKDKLFEIQRKLALNQVKNYNKKWIRHSQVITMKNTQYF